MYQNTTYFFALAFITTAAGLFSLPSHANTTATQAEATEVDTDSTAPVPEAQIPSITVLPFTLRGDIDTTDAGEILADLLLQHISTTEYNVIDSLQTKSLFDEHQQQPADLVQNIDLARQFGHNADIRYLILGSLSRLGSMYYLGVHLLDCTTETTIRNAHVKFNTFDQVDEKLQQLLQQLEVPTNSPVAGSIDNPQETTPMLSDTERIESLYLNNKITQQQAQLGQHLIEADPDTLNQYDIKRREYYQRMLAGSISPIQLQRALKLVDVTEKLDKQNAARNADHEKQVLIESLLTKAKSYDYTKDSLTPLAALDKILELDPTHSEARLLRCEITWHNQPQQVGETWTNSLGMTFTYIPAGQFMMGSPADEPGHNPAEAQHPVILTTPYLLGITEVTQEQWQKVMGDNPSHFKGKTLPVEKINWDDAMAFCQKLSKIDGHRYRLPTEAEWEYACRAGTETAYYFGDNPDDLRSIAWYRDNSRKSSHPVQQKPANPWGLYDIHGNVFEWCYDWYTPEMPQTTTRNPQGPSTGIKRILRGGAWYAKVEACRSAYRGWNTPDSRLYTYGLRVLLELDVDADHNTR